MTEHELSAKRRDGGRSRSQFWALVAIFFGPLLIAFLLYYGVTAWRPAGHTNHGELIQPPVQIPELQLVAGDGAPLPAAVLHDKWTVVYVGAGDCDARCQEALTLIRQTRLALNDDLPRVRRVFLVTESCCNWDYLETAHAGLIVIRLDGAQGAQLKALFQQAAPEPLETAGFMYIIDPLGNLILRYAPGSEPKGLLEDLKRLLKLSHIG